MFRKYEKTFRVLVPQINVKGKFFLSDKETKLLLAGKITITEKIDGANTAIIRHKDIFKLQKRGSLIDIGEHEQFNFFRDWAYKRYDKIMQIPKNLIVYGELMRCVHTIYYDKLPDWFCVFNIYSKNHKEYLPFDEVIDLTNKIGFSRVPFIARNHFDKLDLFDLIPKISNYGSEVAEGIVITNERQQLRGKLVREEFVKDMEESDHWRNQPLRFNKLLKEIE